MAAGFLGSASVAAATNTVVYTVPDTVHYAEVDISVLNPGVSDAVIEVALSKSGTPADADYIEKGAIAFKSGGVVTRTGVKMSPGEKVIVKSTVAGTVVRVGGIELSAK